MALYFLIAPMEDLLTSSIGTLGKYIIILSMAALLIPTLRTKHIEIALDVWDVSKLILYLIILGWLSVVWAYDTETAISRNSAYTTVPLVFLVLSMTEFSNTEQERIRNAAILGGLITIIYIVATQGIIHVMAGRMTLKGTGNDPNNLAALFLLPAGLAYDKIYHSQKISRLLYVITFGVMALFTLLTGSRGGLLSLAVFLIAYFAIGGYWKKVSRAIVFLILLVAITKIVISVLPQELLWRLFSRESYQMAATSSGQRGTIWRHVIFDAIPNMKPWGYGSGCSFTGIIDFYGYRKGIHNTYLCMILEYGVLGIPAFLLLLLRMLKKLLSHKLNAEFAILLGMMVTVFFLDAYAKKFFWNVMYWAIISIKARRGHINGKENIDCHNILSA